MQVGSLIDYESVHAERLTGIPHYLTIISLKRSYHVSLKAAIKTWSHIIGSTPEVVKSTYAPDRLSTNSKQNKRKGL